ncbi:MAG: hypothetical protein R2939_13620 [Kofleriaceae bacterium]
MCGDDGGIIPIDAAGGSDAPPAACNVNTQAGCAAGEKCTWIRVTATPAAQLGVIGCVPDGNVPVDGDCQWGASGQTTGYDNCFAGAYCSASSEQDQAQGTCTDTCSLLDLASNPCDANFVCSRYVNTYANEGDDPPAGLCNPACDPLTQKVKTGDDTADTYCLAPLSDNGTPADTTDDFQIRQCVGFPAGDGAESEFSCAGTINPTWTHRANTDDPQFINSCAPRSLPLLIESDTNPNEGACISLCRPAENYMGSATTLQGVSPYALDDLGVIGTDEECRYWWLLEGDTVSEYSDTLGFAYNVAGLYNWDDDDNPATAEVPLPSCATLANTDTNGNDFPDHCEWACCPTTVAFPPTMTGAKREELKALVRKNLHLEGVSVDMTQIGAALGQ